MNADFASSFCCAKKSFLVFSNRVIFLFKDVELSVLISWSLEYLGYRTVAAVLHLGFYNVWN